MKCMSLYTALYDDGRYFRRHRYCGNYGFRLEHAILNMHCGKSDMQRLKSDPKSSSRLLNTRLLFRNIQAPLHEVGEIRETKQRLQAPLSAKGGTQEEESPSSKGLLWETKLCRSRFVFMLESGVAVPGPKYSKGKSIWRRSFTNAPGS